MLSLAFTELQNVFYAQKTSFLPRWNLISSPPISPLDEPSDLVVYNQWLGVKFLHSGGKREYQEENANDLSDLK